MAYRYDRVGPDTAFLIAYDINTGDGDDEDSTGRRRSALLEAIRDLGLALPFSESAYAVVTNQTSEEIVKTLVPLLRDGVDECSVVELKGPVAGASRKQGGEIHRLLRRGLSG